MLATSFGMEIFSKKYSGAFGGDVDGFYQHLAERLAMGDSSLAARFYTLLTDERFSAGGRILAWNGRPDSRVSLINCTTHQVEDDSLEGISDTVSTIMRASAHGQGIGVDLSRLRPKDAPVNNAAKTSTGAISFMELFNTVGATIGQEGRRAALLFSLDVSHPDLWRPGEADTTCPKCNGGGCMLCRGTGKLPYDFLHIKKLPGRVESANISVMITDDFMRAVEADGDWVLHFDGESAGHPFHVERVVSATALFMELARSAWAAAEPGVLFIDTIRRMSNSDLFGEEWAVRGVNACSEQCLDQDGVCDLGSINLARYVHQPFTAAARFDMPAFIADVEDAVVFLDNVLDIELGEDRAISKTQRHSIEMLRRIGLGVMGFADALAMLELRYSVDDFRTVSFIRRVFGALRDTAYRKSAELAAEKGACGVWAALDQRGRYEMLNRGFYATLPGSVKAHIARHGLRNVALLSMAPTGSIANMYGVSTGIEPVFALEYLRRVRMEGEDKLITYVHPTVSLARSMGVPDEDWDTAYTVSPEDHILIQAEIQQFVDSSIAKTVNFPSEATIQDMADAYLLAWRSGLKGLSVYRDGSRDVQVLYQTEHSAEDEVCPNCGGAVVKHGGCTECPNCGWGKCG